MSGSRPSNKPAASTQPAMSQDQLGQALRQVFYRCTQYAIAHCQMNGNPLRNTNVPGNVKDRFVGLCESSRQAYALLDDQYSRQTVYAKLICVFLEQNVFKVDCFRGFDNHYDGLVQGIQLLNYEHTPVAIRTNLLDSVKTAFEQVGRKPGFKDHVTRKVKDQCEALWPYVQAVFGRKTTADWNDLQQLIEEAHSLSVQLFANPARYMFTYFETGNTFQDSEMTCVSPAFSSYTGATLQNQGFVVSFCVTPRVEMRTYTQAGYISTVAITKGAVLCNAPSIPKPALAPAPAPPVPEDPGKLIGRRR